jgi:hypothetical protein
MPLSSSIQSSVEIFVAATSYLLLLLGALSLGVVRRGLLGLAFFI